MVLLLKLPMNQVEGLIDDFFSSEGQRLKLDKNLARTSILGLLVLGYLKGIIVWLPYSKPERFGDMNAYFVHKILDKYRDERNFIVDSETIQQAIEDFTRCINHFEDSRTKKRR